MPAAEKECKAPAHARSSDERTATGRRLCEWRRYLLPPPFSLTLLHAPARSLLPPFAFRSR